MNNVMHRAEPSLTKQALWMVFARVVGIAVSLAVPMLLVRLFNPSEVGIYRQIMLIVTAAVNILPIGFQMSMFYFVPRDQERASGFVLNVLAFLSVIGAAVCMLFIAWPNVLRYLIGNSALVPYAPLIGLMVLTWMPSSLLELIASVYSDIKASTIFIIISQCAKTVLLLPAVLVFRSIDALLIAAIIQGIVLLVILVVYLRRRFPRFWTRFDPSAFREQLMYALPFGFSAILGTAQSDLHAFLIAHRFSTAEYAIYALGAAQLPLIPLLGDAVNVVMLEESAPSRAEASTVRFARLLFRAIRKLSLVYFPITVVFFIFRTEFVQTMYTSRYLASVPIFAINLMVLPFTALNVDAVLRSYPQFKFQVICVRIATVAMLVATSLAAMSRFGLIGAMSAFLICTAAERIVLFSFCLRLLNAKRRDWWEMSDVAKIALATAVASLIGLLVREGMSNSAPQGTLVLGAAAFLLTYSLLISFLHILHPDEKSAINVYTNRYLGITVFAID